MKPTLVIENVSKRFDGVAALENVSLVCEPGRITGLVGPNGAGKTTLFHLATGFLRPDRGRILYNGTRLDRCSPWRIARLGVGRLFQDVRVFPRLSVLDNVRVAGRSQPGENPLRALLEPGRVRAAEQQNTEAAREWLAFVGLSDIAERPAEQLSYGQQKLLALARLLAGDATLLLLDEPTAGVSPPMVAQILDCLRRLRDAGRTLVVIEHDREVLAALCDTVCVLQNGQVVAQGSPQEAFTPAGSLQPAAGKIPRGQPVAEWAT
jgi:ABC-type branched-subunit amino acid transport system ATPase component